jgi:hypothetical protein
MFRYQKKYTRASEKSSRRRIFFGDFLRLAGYHKTAKPALEILANRPFSGPTGSQKGGCRMTRLADFELNFEDETRKKPGGIHRAIRIEWWSAARFSEAPLFPNKELSLI